MQSLLLIFHVLIALLLMLLVVIQQGKASEMGAALGAGASSTVFGSQGATSFLTRLTGGLVLLFFISSLALGYLTTHQYRAAHGLDFKAQSTTQPKKK